MYTTLKRLYDNGDIGETELDTSISRGWITEEQKNTIMNE